MKECVEWRGALSKKGYGVIKIDKVNMFTHRLSYSLFNGSIPRGMFVCHKCDNPKCINPEHLFIGTPKENTDDMSNKGRGLYGRRPLVLTNIKTNEEWFFNSQYEVAEHLGVNQGTVSYALKRNNLIGKTYKVQYNSQNP